MLIHPLPGFDRHDIIKAFREAETRAHNLSGAHHPVGLYNKYLQWVIDTERQLRGMVRAADLDRLIRTPRFWALHGLNIEGMSSATAFDVVRVEVENVVEALTEARKSLEFIDTRWPERETVLIVCDTSVYCQYPHKLENADLAGALGLADRDIHLLFPAVVVEELDRHKESKNDHLRFRGGYTLAVLERHLDLPNETGVLRESGPSPEDPDIHRGRVTVEVLADPLTHTRLDDPDAEIIDRALAVDRLTEQRLIFVTYDTYQAFQARGEGLTVHKLSGAVPQEPDPNAGPAPSRRAKRAARAAANATASNADEAG